MKCAASLGLGLIGLRSGEGGVADKSRQSQQTPDTLTPSHPLLSTLQCCSSLSLLSVCHPFNSQLCKYTTTQCSELNFLPFSPFLEGFLSSFSHLCRTVNEPKQIICQKYTRSMFSLRFHILLNFCLILQCVCVSIRTTKNPRSLQERELHVKASGA